MLLLIEVEVGKRLLGLLQLLIRLFDQGALRFDVLAGRGLRGQQELLLGLGDGIQGCLDFFVLRSSHDLVQARPVGFELFT